MRHGSEHMSIDQRAVQAISLNHETRKDMPSPHSPAVPQNQKAAVEVLPLRKQPELLLRQERACIRS